MAYIAFGVCCIYKEIHAVTFDARDFEAIAISLWLTKDNIFYLFNFSYIGASIALGTALISEKKTYARHVVQFLVGSYMLVYLGIICD